MTTPTTSTTISRFCSLRWVSPRLDNNSNNNKISINCMNCLHLKWSLFELFKIEIRFDIILRVVIYYVIVRVVPSFVVVATVQQQHKQHNSNRDGPCHYNGYCLCLLEILFRSRRAFVCHCCYGTTTSITSNRYVPCCLHGYC